jgi:hypothetical protein
VRVARWFAGVVAAYTSFEVLAASLLLVWRSIGYDVPIVHDDPPFFVDPLIRVCEAIG